MPGAVPPARSSASVLMARDDPYPLSGRVPEHRKEVTDRAHQDEHVPDEMAVAHAVRRIERDASRVGDAAGDEPQPARQRYANPQRSNRDNRKPSHSDIEGGGQPGPPDARHGLHRDAEHGQTPHGTE